MYHRGTLQDMRLYQKEGSLVREGRVTVTKKEAGYWLKSRRRNIYASRGMCRNEGGEGRIRYLGGRTHTGPMAWLMYDWKLHALTVFASSAICDLGTFQLVEAQNNIVKNCVPISVADPDLDRFAWSGNFTTKSVSGSSSGSFLKRSVSVLYRAYVYLFTP